MARPRRDVNYDADTDTYRDYLRRGVELDQERKAIQRKISVFNSDAAKAGAHPGAIALARRLRRIEDLDKRRVELREYARALIELEDEILAAGVGHNLGPTIGKEERSPFGRKSAA